MIRKIAPPVYAIDADALYAEYATRGIEFPRALDDLPWNSHRWTRIKQESYPCLSVAKRILQKLNRSANCIILGSAAN